MRRELDFTYDGKRVGYFEEPVCPSTPGRYRYMPYRSIGHYELNIALRAGRRPRCAVPSHPGKSFTVLSCPEYGVLELAEFSAARRDSLLNIEDSGPE